MFVMTNDGGVVQSTSAKAAAERVLLQRVFVYSLLSQGVSVTLLHGAQYRDSRVSSLLRLPKYHSHIGVDHVFRL